MNSPDAMLEEARDLDAADPLRDRRDRFALPAGVAYLDGNSLGPLPVAARGAMRDAVERQWGRDLIRSWNDNGWIDAPARVGGKISRLLNARPDEVIVTDSVSVNLFKLLSALVRARPDRTTILTEAGNFPTDPHVAQGLAESVRLRVELAPRDELASRMNGETAALLLTHVHYRTGERFDMAAVNAAARARDVPVLWDLSHSVGAVPLDLPAAGTRYAVGCGYKYLNGGPGAPAFLYVAADRQDELRPALQGWMGHAAPFDFTDAYRPAAGMGRFLVGTPPVLSLLALECGVAEFLEVDMEILWAKSQRLFDFLVRHSAAACPQLDLVTPREAAARGSHAAFSHPDAWPINNALIAPRGDRGFSHPGRAAVRPRPALHVVRGPCRCGGDTPGSDRK